jgi:hypothetical protein
MIKKNDKMCQICLRMVHHTFTSKRRCRKCYARYVLSGGIKSVFNLHDQLGTSRNLIKNLKATVNRLGSQKCKLVARVQELSSRVQELEKSNGQKYVETFSRPWYDSASLPPHSSTMNGRNQ